VSVSIARAVRARHGESRAEGERGAAAVEFAIIVPFLCFLLFAIISYGYMLSFRQALSQSAAEAARAAAVAPASATDADLTTRAVQAINQGLSSYGVTCTSAEVLMHAGEQAGTCDIQLPAQACSGSTVGAKCVKVVVSYTYKDDSLLPTFPGLGVVLPETLSYTTEAQVS
jgi:Flp pilus assembly protein TadG